MRKSLSIIMLGLVAMAATASARADNLFSSVSIGSPFGSSENQGATPRQATPKRLAGPASLTEMLRNAGLEPREIDTQIVSVKIQRGGSTLPVLITFTEDYARLRMVMILSIQKEGQSIPTESLMGLMDANRQNSAAFFAYSKKQRRTELHRIVENRSMTPDRLKTELTGLAGIAEQSKQLWAINAESTAPPSAAGNTAATPKPTPVTAPVASPTPAPAQANPALVGKWAAARSKTEAFALQINTNGTFALVTVSGGKTSQSTGKFTLVGSKLTLTDTKGTQIAGSVTLSSAKEFKFLPVGAKTPLTFKKPA